MHYVIYNISGNIDLTSSIVQCFDESMILICVIVVCLIITVLLYSTIIMNDDIKSIEMKLPAV